VPVIDVAQVVAAIDGLAGFTALGMEPDYLNDNGWERVSPIAGTS
jgi:hypothetical protein